MEETRQDTTYRMTPYIQHFAKDQTLGTEVGSVVSRSGIEERAKENSGANGNPLNFDRGERYTCV